VTEHEWHHQSQDDYGGSSGYPAPSRATPGAAVATSTNALCGNGGTGYCLNDWNNGGNGNPIKMYYGHSSNETFNIYYLTGMCGDGHVHTSPACPFANGSGLNAQYNTSVIVKIEYAFSGLCVGTTQNDNHTILTPCPDNNGNNGGWSSIWVLAGESGCFSSFQSLFESRYWSNQYSANQYDTSGSLQSGGNPGVQALVPPGSDNTCWGYVVN